MGCWHGTCFLSNVEISWSDKIKLQLLMPNINQFKSPTIDIKTYNVKTDTRDINGHIYITDTYKPFAFPISGKYNDYDSIEEVENDTALDILESFIKALIDDSKIKLLPEWSDDIAFSIKDFSYDNLNEIENFIELVERGRIIVKNDYGIWCRLKFVMMHEGMYNSIFDNEDNATRSWEKDLIGLLFNDSMSDEFKNENKRELEYLEIMKSEKVIIDNNNFESKSEEERQTHIEKYASAEFMFNMGINEHAWGIFRWSETRPYSLYTLQKIITNSDKQSCIKRLKLAGDYLIVHDYLSNLNKPWDLPRSGSQDGNEDYVKAHVKTISKFITKYKKGKYDR